MDAFDAGIENPVFDASTEAIGPPHPTPEPA